MDNYDLKILEKKDIEELVDKYGLEDERYWRSVRHLGIRYWVGWDRNDLFDVSVMENASSEDKGCAARP